MLAALVLALALQDKPHDTSTLVKVADNARLPHLALDTDGNAYCAFVRNGNIEVATSSDGGKTFNPPTTALDLKGKDAAIQNRGPRISIDRARRLYVSAPADGALLLSVSSDKGKTFSKPATIPDAPEGVHATAGGAADLHVAWLSGKSLLYARFDSAGKRTGKAPLPVTGNACENCPPGLAVDPAGNPTLVWRESKQPRSVFLARSADGGKSFPAPAQLNSIETGLTECPQDAPAAASDGKTLAAAWMDRRDVERDADVYWVFGPPGKLSPDTDCLDDRRFQQRRPTLALDADATVWCAWEDSRLSSQRVFFTNSKIDANIALGDAKELSSWPSLASCPTKVAVAYQVGKDVGFRVLK